MLKKIFVFSFLLFIIILVIFTNVKDNFQNINLKNISDLEKVLKDSILENIEKTIYNPPPLINKNDVEDSYLTNNGVLKWTNIQRDRTESLPPLAQNDLLDKIATERLEDMFSKQYFEHQSPEGIEASDIAKEIGYKYILIGENIALGNFKDDQTLVQAWMDSPGHRANILNNSYTQIGIAVKKGIYKEQETWIGVQIFARPLSDCPQVNPNLRIEIEENKDQITNLENLSFALQEEIENMNPTSRQDIKIYNRKIDEYNEIIKNINILIKTQKNLILEYNNQIDAFNKCIQR